MTTAEDTPHFAAGFADEGLRTFATENFKTPDEAVGFAQKFHGFKDADPASLIALPKDQTPEALMPILRKLGAPEKGEAYKLGERKGADKEFAGAMSELLASAGLTPWQATLLVDGFAKYTGERTGAEKTAFETKTKQELEREQAGLKTKWGAEYEAKMEVGRRAMRTAGKALGKSDEEMGELIGHLEAFTGYSGVIEMMNFFGGQMKESTFVDGGGGKVEPKDGWRAAYADDHKAQPSA